VIDHPEFFEKIYHLFQHTKRVIKRESLWILSNLAAGIEKERRNLFHSFPFMEKLIFYIFNEPEDVNK